MGSVAVMSPYLHSIPDGVPAPRPPTPPREAQHDPARQLFLGQSLDRRLSIQTPPNVYSPSELSTGSGDSRRTRKRVGFSGQMEYKDPPNYSQDATKHHPTPVSLPSSTSKPIKSILKPPPTNPLSSSTLGQISDADGSNASIALMLESTIQQLAGADRDSKADAYSVLVSSLKASNNLPDRVALQEKMPLFMQFMQRDILSKTPEGKPDSRLIVHALNLLTTFLHFPAIAASITTDFGIFIIDHCIRSLENDTSKDILRHLMHVLFEQNFSSKVMSSDRVGRLIAALHGVEQYCTGKSIKMSRILIYRRLVKQCKHQMLAHTEWVQDLFRDMEDGEIKELRGAAVALGLDVVFSLGREKTLSRRVNEMLNTVPEGETERPIDSFRKTLSDLVENTDKDSQQLHMVPQMWSVAVLLLRIPFENRSFFSKSLSIIQKCFNGSDYETRIEANNAWNRLVYLQHQDERALARTINTLSQPFRAQLTRKGSGKQAEDFRKVVLGGICNLFYYAFKPSTNLTLLDDFWDGGVQPLMEQLVHSKSKYAPNAFTEACEILSGLFDSVTQRIWSEDRVVNTKPVQPSELPAIDSKWLRRKARRVLNVVEPILADQFMDLAVEDSAISRLWKTLVASVASAAVKEIKVSADTASFIAASFNTLSKLWMSGPSSSASEHNTGDLFLRSTNVFVSTLIQAFGMLPFTEKLLSKDKTDAFIAANTPSHRPSKHHGIVKAPLHHLFSMLSSPPSGVNDNAAFAEFFDSIFGPFFAAKSDKLRVELVMEMFVLLPADVSVSYGPLLTLSTQLTASFKLAQGDHSGSENSQLGHEYRNAVKVLERGLRSTPNMPFKSWQSLFSIVSERVREETGEAGLAIAVIEPLSRAALETLDKPGNRPEILLRSTLELLSSASQPRDRQAVEAARRRLWGTVIGVPRTSSYDTLDHLYKLVGRVLEQLYEDVEGGDDDFSMQLLVALRSFMERANAQLVNKAVAVMQHGIGCWIRDERGRVNSRAQPALSEATRRLWEKACAVILDADQASAQLNIFETLLCDAFESKHRQIVTVALNAWNSAFEHADQIAYPEKLKDVFLASRSFVDIVLPGLDITSAYSSVQQHQQPAFVETQADDLPTLSLTSVKSSRSSRRNTPRPSSSHSSASPGHVSLSHPQKHRLELTPVAKASSTAARPKSSTPRIRHDDSQIEFARIDSSPSIAQQIESQLLTERQREVRDRQRDNDALFPGIASSSPNRKAHDQILPETSLESMNQSSPELSRAVTPKGSHAFDDYVSSTPTPRRGQLLALSENDVNDPPSSPPEPRRNPFVEEMRTRSASSSVIDIEDWQITSSPLSGSPRPMRQLVNEQPTEDLGLDDMDLDMEAENEVQNSIGKSITNDVEADVESSAADQHVAKPTNEDLPSTPNRQLRTTIRQETPKSGDEIFTDARSSPLPPTPRRSARHLIKGNSNAGPSRTANDMPQSQSFDDSELDASMQRLVVEIETATINRSEYARVAEAPQVPALTSAASNHAVFAADGKDEVETLDCIEVGSSPVAKSRRGRPPKKTTASAAASVTPSSVSAEPLAESSRANVQEKRRKRKSSSSKVAEPSSKRRRSHPSPELGEGDAVFDSQLTTASQQEERAGPRRRGRSSRNLAAVDIEEAHEKEASKKSYGPAEEEERQHATNANVTLPDEEQLSNEENLQSQISEEAESQMQAEVEEPAVAADLTVSATEDPTEDVQDVQMEGGPAQAVAEPGAIETADSGAGEQEENKFGKLMAMLRGGLDDLRGLQLSREEVHQMEDVFMDMKRELYEAERRGRTA